MARRFKFHARRWDTKQTELTPCPRTGSGRRRSDNGNQRLNGDAGLFPINPDFRFSLGATASWLTKTASSTISADRAPDPVHVQPIRDNVKFCLSSSPTLR